MFLTKAHWYKLENNKAATEAHKKNLTFNGELI